MNNFSANATITTVKNYEISSWAIDEVATDIENAINDCILNNLEVYEANEVPLAIRQKLLRHVVEEMLDPNFGYRWD